MYTKKRVLNAFWSMGMKWWQWPTEWIKLTFSRKYKQMWLEKEWIDDSNEQEDEHGTTDVW